MILVDANLLIYAHVRGFAQHAAARSWLDSALSGDHRVGLPWPTLLAFLRIVTNPRLFERPEPIGEAWKQVHTWLRAEVAWIPVPTDRHPDVMERLLAAPGLQGNRVPDAHLAALAVEHGLTVCSTDGDFGRFPGLSWRNPLAAG